MLKMGGSRSTDVWVMASGLDELRSMAEACYAFADCVVPGVAGAVRTGGMNRASPVLSGWVAAGLAPENGFSPDWCGAAVLV